ncbi:unnamed protein product [Closterium sp. Yama58-4]|nr:unnamed protein product [Closterium sp. Yama58-4]
MKRLRSSDSNFWKIRPGFSPNENGSSSVHVSGRERLFRRASAQSRHWDWVENDSGGDNPLGDGDKVDDSYGSDNFYSPADSDGDRRNPYAGHKAYGSNKSYGQDSLRADGGSPVIPHDVAKALVDSLAKVHESARENDEDDGDFYALTSEAPQEHESVQEPQPLAVPAAKEAANLESDRDRASRGAALRAARDFSHTPVDFQTPAVARGSSGNQRSGNHRVDSEARRGHNRSSEEELVLSSWCWPAESALADSASSGGASSVAAGSGEAAVVRQLAFNGWSSDVVRVAPPGRIAPRRKASIAKPLLITSLLCGAALLYRGTLTDKGIPLLHSRRDSVTTISAHEVASSQETAKERRGQKAGAAGGEVEDGREEQRREGMGLEASEEESVKEDGKESGEGELGSVLGEGEVERRGAEVGAWRGEVVGRGKEERMRVVVAPHVNPEHARLLEGLKELQVIGADVAPAGICTRREFATWLMAFSEKLSASPTDRVYPAMFIEGISEQAYADVAPDDKDFAAIQGLAEAGILPSLLGRRDEVGGAAAGEGAGEGEALFRPDSPLTRQDLLTWRFALEYSHLPPADLVALRHTCGLIDAARISPAAQRAPVTHAQAAAALTFGRTYETVNEAAVRVEVAEARKAADVARQEAESARKEAARLAEEMERVRREEEEEVRKEKEERESVERERESLREEVERLRAEIASVGRVSSSSGDADGGVEGKLSSASGGLEGGEEEDAIGVAGEGVQGLVSEREAGGGGASVEGSASDGTEEGRSSDGVDACTAGTAWHHQKIFRWCRCLHSRHSVAPPEDLPMVSMPAQQAQRGTTRRSSDGVDACTAGTAWHHQKIFRWCRCLHSRHSRHSVAPPEYLPMVSMPAQQAQRGTTRRSSDGVDACTAGTAWHHQKIFRWCRCLHSRHSVAPPEDLPMVSMPAQQAQRGTTRRSSDGVDACTAGTAGTAWHHQKIFRWCRCLHSRHSVAPPEDLPMVSMPAQQAQRGTTRRSSDGVDACTAGTAWHHQKIFRWCRCLHSRHSVAPPEDLPMVSMPAQQAQRGTTRRSSDGVDACTAGTAGTAWHHQKIFRWCRCLHSRHSRHSVAPPEYLPMVSMPAQQAQRGTTRISSDSVDACTAGTAWHHQNIFRWCRCLHSRHSVAPPEYLPMVSMPAQQAQRGTTRRSSDGVDACTAGTAGTAWHHQNIFRWCRCLHSRHSVAPPEYLPIVSMPAQQAQRGTTRISSDGVDACTAGTAWHHQKIFRWCRCLHSRHSVAPPEDLPMVSMPAQQAQQAQRGTTRISSDGVDACTAGTAWHHQNIFRWHSVAPPEDLPMVSMPAQQAQRGTTRISSDGVDACTAGTAWHHQKIFRWCRCLHSRHSVAPPEDLPMVSMPAQQAQRGTTRISSDGVDACTAGTAWHHQKIFRWCRCLHSRHSVAPPEDLPMVSTPAQQAQRGTTRISSDGVDACTAGTAWHHQNIFRWCRCLHSRHSVAPPEYLPMVSMPAQQAQRGTTRISSDGVDACTAGTAWHHQKIFRWCRCLHSRHSRHSVAPPEYLPMVSMPAQQAQRGTTRISSDSVDACTAGTAWHHQNIFRWCRCLHSRHSVAPPEYLPMVSMPAQQAQRGTTRRSSDGVDACTAGTAWHHQNIFRWCRCLHSRHSVAPPEDLPMVSMPAQQAQRGTTRRSSDGVDACTAGTAGTAWHHQNIFRWCRCLHSRHSVAPPEYLPIVSMPAQQAQRGTTRISSDGVDACTAGTAWHHQNIFRWCRCLHSRHSVAPPEDLPMVSMPAQQAQRGTTRISSDGVDACTAGTAWHHQKIFRWCRCLHSRHSVAPPEDLPMVSMPAQQAQRGTTRISSDGVDACTAGTAWHHQNIFRWHSVAPPEYLPMVSMPAQQAQRGTTRRSSDGVDACTAWHHQNIFRWCRCLHSRHSVAPPEYLPMVSMPAQQAQRGTTRISSDGVDACTAGTAWHHQNIFRWCRCLHSRHSVAPPEDLPMVSMPAQQAQRGTTRISSDGVDACTAGTAGTAWHHQKIFRWCRCLHSRHSRHSVAPPEYLPMVSMPAQQAQRGTTRISSDSVDACTAGTAWHHQNIFRWCRCLHSRHSVAPPEYLPMVSMPAQQAQRGTTRRSSDGVDACTAGTAWHHQKIFRWCRCLHSRHSVAPPEDLPMVSMPAQQAQRGTTRRSSDGVDACTAGTAWHHQKIFRWCRCLHSRHSVAPPEDLPMVSMPAQQAQRGTTRRSSDGVDACTAGTAWHHQNIFRWCRCLHSRHSVEPPEDLPMVSMPAQQAQRGTTRRSSDGVDACTAGTAWHHQKIFRWCRCLHSRHSVAPPEDLPMVSMPAQQAQRGTTRISSDGVDACTAGTAWYHQKIFRWCRCLHSRHSVAPPEDLPMVSMPAQQAQRGTTRISSDGVDACTAGTAWHHQKIFRWCRCLHSRHSVAPPEYLPMVSMPAQQAQRGTTRRSSDGVDACTAGTAWHHQNIFRWCRCLHSRHSVAPPEDLPMVSMPAQQAQRGTTRRSSDGVDACTAGTAWHHQKIFRWCRCLHSRHSVAPPEYLPMVSMPAQQAQRGTTRRSSDGVDACTAGTAWHHQNIFRWCRCLHSRHSVAPPEYLPMVSMPAQQAQRGTTRRSSDGVDACTAGTAWHHQKIFRWCRCLHSRHSVAPPEDLPMVSMPAQQAQRGTTRRSSDGVDACTAGTTWHHQKIFRWCRCLHSRHSVAPPEDLPMVSMPAQQAQRGTTRRSSDGVDACTAGTAWHHQKIFRWCRCLHSRHSVAPPEDLPMVSMPAQQAQRGTTRRSSDGVDACTAGTAWHHQNIFRWCRCLHSRHSVAPPEDLPMVSMPAQQAQRGTTRRSSDGVDACTAGTAWHHQNIFRWCRCLHSRHSVAPPEDLPMVSMPAQQAQRGTTRISSDGVDACTAGTAWHHQNIFRWCRCLHSRHSVAPPEDLPMVSMPAQQAQRGTTRRSSDGVDACTAGTAWHHQKIFRWCRCLHSRHSVAPPEYLPMVSMPAQQAQRGTTRISSDGVDACTAGTAWHHQNIFRWCRCLHSRHSVAPPEDLPMVSMPAQQAQRGTTRISSDGVDACTAGTAWHHQNIFRWCRCLHSRHSVAPPEDLPMVSMPAQQAQRGTTRISSDGVDACTAGTAWHHQNIFRWCRCLHSRHSVAPPEDLPMVSMPAQQAQRGTTRISSDGVDACTAGTAWHHQNIFRWCRCLHSRHSVAPPEYLLMVSMPAQQAQRGTTRISSDGVDACTAGTAWHHQNIFRWCRCLHSRHSVAPPEYLPMVSMPAQQAQRGTTRISSDGVDACTAGTAWHHQKIFRWCRCLHSRHSVAPPEDLPMVSMPAQQAQRGTTRISSDGVDACTAGTAWHHQNIFRWCRCLHSRHSVAPPEYLPMVSMPAQQAQRGTTRISSDGVDACTAGTAWHHQNIFRWCRCLHSRHSVAPPEDLPMVSMPAQQAQRGTTRRSSDGVDACTAGTAWHHQKIFRWCRCLHSRHSVAPPEDLPMVSMPAQQAQRGTTRISSDGVDACTAGTAWHHQKIFRWCRCLHSRHSVAPPEYLPMVSMPAQQAQRGTTRISSDGVDACTAGTAWHHQNIFRWCRCLHSRHSVAPPEYLPMVSMPAQQAQRGTTRISSDGVDACTAGTAWHHQNIFRWCRCLHSRHSVAPPEYLPMVSMPAQQAQRGTTRRSSDGVDACTAGTAWHHQKIFRWCRCLHSRHSVAPPEYLPMVSMPAQQAQRGTTRRSSDGVDACTAGTAWHHQNIFRWCRCLHSRHSVAPPEDLPMVSMPAQQAQRGTTRISSDGVDACTAGTAWHHQKIFRWCRCLHSRHSVAPPEYLPMVSMPAQQAQRGTTRISSDGVDACTAGTAWHHQNIFRWCRCLHSRHSVAPPEYLPMVSMPAQQAQRGTTRRSSDGVDACTAGTAWHHQKIFYLFPFWMRPSLCFSKPIQPAILPPGWWADLIQQRAEEAKHGAAKNLIRIKERSADVASSLAGSVADGSLQRLVVEKAEEAARKVQKLQDMGFERAAGELKEGARMVRQLMGGEVARRIEGLRSGKMLVPKKNRLLVYKYLFSEGVLFAEKDFNLPKHPELEVPNLQVIKLMQSFKSKGFVRETFAWRHYYWYLTNEGIEHLRDYLNLPSEIVPATLKKSSRPPGRPMGAGGDRPPRRFEGGRGYGDREGYRGYGAGGDDKAAATVLQS